ncbi:sugar-phosphatase [Salmonella enterica subsp. enterica]|nr:sugar-phosphatase [Salmonella enterica subsp. enterica]
MAIKLIAIDMDGTLLLPDHTISPAVKNAIAAAREKGVNVVLTTGRPYAGVHSYLKELHMEQPGDYCITYNGALVQKAGDGSTVAQTALSYDDYRYLEKLSREVGSHFHALDRNTLYTANRDISYYTVHESYVATIPLVFCEAEKMDPNTQFLKVMMIDEPAVLDLTMPSATLQRLVSMANYNNNGRFDVKQHLQSPWNMLLGAQYEITRHFNVTTEFGFAERNSFFVAGEYRF